MGFVCGLQWEKLWPLIFKGIGGFSGLAFFATATIVSFFLKVHVHCVRRAGDLCLSHPFYSGFIFPSFPLPLLGHDRIALKATEEQRWFQNVRKKRRPERRGKRKKEETCMAAVTPCVLWDQGFERQGSFSPIARKGGTVQRGKEGLCTTGTTTFSFFFTSYAMKQMRAGSSISRERI